MVPFQINTSHEPQPHHVFLSFFRFVGLGGNFSPTYFCPSKRNRFNLIEPFEVSWCLMNITQISMVEWLNGPSSLRSNIHKDDFLSFYLLNNVMLDLVIFNPNFDRWWQMTMLKRMIINLVFPNLIAVPNDVVPISPSSSTFLNFQTFTISISFLLLLKNIFNFFKTKIRKYDVYIFLLINRPYFF